MPTLYANHELFTGSSVDDDPESLVLLSLFDLLSSARIHYAVMRNYEPLPLGTGGSDLDILVRPIDALITKECVLRAIERAEGVTIGCVNTVGFFKVYAFGQNKKHVKKWWGLRIDVNLGLSYKGMPLLDEEGWRNFTFNYYDIVVLTDGLAGVLGVLKEVLNNSQVPPRYLIPAQKAISENWSNIKGALRPMGDRALDLFHKIVTIGLDDECLPQRCRNLRATLLIHAVRRHPLLTLKHRFCFELSKCNRFISPSGVVLAFLGADGAGKSTVVNAILPVLEAATHNATFIKHLRPGLLPPLARFKGKREAHVGPVRNPHESKPSGCIGSFFRSSYLAMDYILGYWLLTRPTIAKQPAVVIFDRYAYDVILDSRRFRISLPPKLLSCFSLLFPKPDIIFCLHGSAETIAERKKELPTDEVSRQIKALKAFAAREPNAVLISSETSIDMTREETLILLKDYLRKKNYKKYK